MTGAPSSTWFSVAPDWGWLVALYLFVGGLAGASYFLAAVIDFFGRREDRPLAHLGYYIALPCVLLSGLLLTLDLTRPLRFWHMLIESNTYRPMFKYWSPMSIGSWVLLIFGAFALLSFLGTLAEDGRVASRALGRLRPPTALGRAITLLGGLGGFYMASYTGVLLAVTNRPIWSDTPLLGMLFIVSASSSAAALIILLAHRTGLAVPGLAALYRTDRWVIALELLVLIALVVSLGPAARAWVSAWGVLLIIVVVLGQVVPLALSWRAGPEQHVATAAVLVLLGGLLLRFVIVFSAESV